MFSICQKKKQKSITFFKKAWKFSKWEKFQWDLSGKNESLLFNPHQQFVIIDNTNVFIILVLDSLQKMALVKTKQQETD